MSRAVRGVLMGFVVWGLAAVAAEEYQGRIMEVIDQVNLHHPELTIGVDPSIIHEVIDKEVTCKLGDDWQADLKTVLMTVNLTTISMKQYDHLLVTTPSALLAYRALASVGAYRFDDAAKYFDQALRQEPDNLQLQILLRTCNDLQPLYANVLKRDKSLADAIDDRRPEDTVSGRAGRYADAWGEMWRTFWADYELLTERGLTTELQPFFSFASGQISRFLTLMSLTQRKYPGVVDERSVMAVKVLQRELSNAAMMVEGHVKKGQLLIDRGEELFKEGKKDLALNVFQQAYEQYPSDLKARTYLGWLQAGLRLQRRQEQQAYLAARQHDPTPEAQKAGLATMVDWIVAGRHREQARLLLALQSGDRLGVSLDIGTVARLNQIATAKPPEEQIGVLDGLVTHGGEFIGGELFPISVTMGPRQDLSKYHEVVINDVAQQLDGYMRISIVQAFGWLDQRAKGILRNYRITLHFKDLESAKGGDSLGAGIATAAFSTLYQRPVRHGVTMTGSIRAYGGIAAIGGVPAKLQAAIEGHKELIVFPADNEADMLLVSPTAFATIRVLLATKIDDYLLVALEDAAPPPDIANRDRAELLYWTARIFDSMGRAREAHGIYAKVLQLAPNDYSARFAVDLYAKGNIPALTPAWVDGFGLDEDEVTQPAAAAAAVTRADMMQDIPRLLALQATLLRSQGEAAASDDLLAAVLELDPKQRDALLLKAKVLMNREVTPPDPPPMPKAELANLLMTRAEAGRASGTPELVALANLYTALVIKHLQPGNEAALIQYATIAGTGEPPTVAALLAKVKEAASPAPAAGEQPKAGFDLKPLRVAAVDPALLPTEGSIWTAGEPDDDITGDPGDETVELPTAKPTTTAPTSRLDMGGTIERAEPAGSASLIVVKNRGASRLTVVDVSKRQVVRTIEIGSSNSLFAAGRDLVVVYDTTGHSLSVYSLRSGNRLRTQKLPGNDYIEAMDMGCMSNGPVVTSLISNGAASFALLDPISMRVTAINGKTTIHTPGSFQKIRVSADGKRFSSWSFRHSGRAVLGKITGATAQIKEIPYSGGHLVPAGARDLWMGGMKNGYDFSGRVVCSTEKASWSGYSDVDGQYVFMEAGREIYLITTRNMSYAGIAPIANHFTEVDNSAAQRGPSDMTMDSRLLLFSRRQTFVWVLNSQLEFAPAPIAADANNIFINEVKWRAYP